MIEQSLAYTLHYHHKLYQLDEQCLLPPFSDSFFESFLSEDSLRSPDNFSGNLSDTFELSFSHIDPRANTICDASVSSPSETFNASVELKNLRRNNYRKCMVGFLNINSIRNKFQDLQDLFQENLDIFGICETKIDGSFPDPQFSMPNYHMFRRDRDSFGGGLLAYIRSDLPCQRLAQL